MNFLSSFSTGMDVADMAWEVRCREEDMRQRALDNTRRLIDDARRAVDEKTEQLKAVSSLSALIAGFGMVVLVEMAPLPGIAGMRCDATRCDTMWYEMVMHVWYRGSKWSVMYIIRNYNIICGELDDRAVCNGIVLMFVCVCWGCTGCVDAACNAQQYFYSNSDFEIRLRKAHCTL